MEVLELLKDSWLLQIMSSRCRCHESSTANMEGIELTSKHGRSDRCVTDKWKSGEPFSNPFPHQSYSGKTHCCPTAETHNCVRRASIFVGN